MTFHQQKYKLNSLKILRPSLKYILSFTSKMGKREVLCIFLMIQNSKVRKQIFLLFMIVRANRSQSKLKGIQHRRFQTLIEELQKQNKELRLQLLRIEQRLLETQLAKKKYKSKYRQAKQKVQILALVKFNHSKINDPYDICMSPKTKTTRIKTASEEEFNSIKVGIGSQLDEQIETKVEIDHYPHFTGRKTNTATSTMKEIQLNADPNQDRILQNLLKLHQQLETLSSQIQQKPNIEAKVLTMQTQLYRKMQEVVQKVNKMQLRDMDRENRRLSHQKQRAARKYNTSMKKIESIGKDLLDFRVDQ